MKDNNKKAENKTTIRTIIIAIFIFFGVMTLSSMWSGTDTKPISETNPNEKLVAKEKYYYDSFVKGCEKGGGSTGECQCVLTKVKQKWTFEEFEAIAKEYANTSKLPDAFAQMTADCMEV